MEIFIFCHLILRCKMMQKVRPANEKRKYLLITESLRTELQEIFVFLHDNCE